MNAIVKDEEPTPIKTVEDIAEKFTDRSQWESFCGRYERKEEAGFTVDEVYMKDGELYVRAFEDEDEIEIRLYQVGENEFGRKDNWQILRFGENCIYYDDMTCRRL